MGTIKIRPTLALRPYTKDSGFIAKAINWWCHSEYYHAELILGNSWISATPKEGIYVNKLRPLDHTKYEYLELPELEISQEVYNNIWDYINKQISPKYDTLGLFWNQVLGFSFYNKEWFCSELIAEILILLGYKKLYGTNGAEYSPQDLYDIFTSSEPIKLRRYSLLIRFKKAIKFIIDVIKCISLKKWYLKCLFLLKKIFKKKPKN